MKIIESAKISVFYEKNAGRLSERERDIIERYYSLGGYTRHSLDDIAKLYKVTRERIRQIKAVALNKLQNKE